MNRPVKSTRVAYAIRERAGKPGGGKGMLVQINVTGSIQTSNDQIIVAPTKKRILGHCENDTR